MSYDHWLTTHTHTRLTALFPRLPGWAGTRNLKQIWIYWSKRQWVAVASAGPYASLHLAPAPHHSVFYRPDALPATQPTASKHWRQDHWLTNKAYLSTITVTNISQSFYLQHTHTHPFNGPFSGTTRLSQHQKGKTNLDFTEARESEWQWHQLGHMQVCTSLQTDNHTSTPPLSFLKAGCPSCHSTNSVKALKATRSRQKSAGIDIEQNYVTVTLYYCHF